MLIHTDTGINGSVSCTTNIIANGERHLLWKLFSFCTITELIHTGKRISMALVIIRHSIQVTKKEKKKRNDRHFIIVSVLQSRLEPGGNDTNQGA